MEDVATLRYCLAQLAKLLEWDSNPRRWITSPVLYRLSYPLASPNGFEPSTSDSMSRRSHPLSYGDLLHAAFSHRYAATQRAPRQTARVSPKPLSLAMKRTDLPVDAINCALIRLISRSTRRIRARPLPGPGTATFARRPRMSWHDATAFHRVIAAVPGQCRAAGAPAARRKSKTPGDSRLQGFCSLGRPARAGLVRTWPTSFRRSRQHAGARVGRGAAAAVLRLEEVSIHGGVLDFGNGCRWAGRALYAPFVSRQ